MIYKNAYHMLGLDLSASQKEIQKRAKDIINHLKIDEQPTYESDLGLFDDFRKESDVKDAASKLTNPADKTKEYFFWFDIRDSVDEAAISYIRDKDFNSCIEAWNNGIASKPANYNYRKNLALFLLLLLNQKSDKTSLNRSIDLWHDVVTSDKYWTAFKKSFILNDDMGAQEKVILSFKDKVVECLSEYYIDLKQKYSDDSYVLEFSKKFPHHSSKMYSEELDPILLDVTKYTEMLQKMDISADGVVDEEEQKQLDQFVGAIKINMGKLKALGLYDDGRVIAVRDRAADAIRSCALDIYNNIGEKKIPKKLTADALEMVATQGFKHKIDRDIEIFADNDYWDNLIALVIKLRKEGKEDEALEKIKAEEKKNKDNKESLEFLVRMKKTCFRDLILSKYNTATELLNKDKYKKSQDVFYEVRALLDKNISLYNINEKAVKEIIDDAVNSMYRVVWTNCDETFKLLRKNVIDAGNKVFKDQPEELDVLIMWLDSYIMPLYIDCIREVKMRSKIIEGLQLVAWFTLILYGLGILFFIIAEVYKGRPLLRRG